MLDDTMDAVIGDLHDVFCWSASERPQERAHRYLTEHRVSRGYDDTAMQVAATHAAQRAYAVGRAEALRSLCGSEGLPAELTRLSGDLLGLAVEMRGMTLGLPASGGGVCDD